MRSKKTVISSLIVLSLLYTSISPVFAAGKDAKATDNSKGYIWNQATGQVTSYDPSTFQTEVTIPVKSDKQVQDKNTQSNTGSISPMGIPLPVFDHYSENSESLNWQQKYVGVTRVDNSGNKYSSASIIYQASTTDTWTRSGTTGLETSAEMDAIVAKVKVTASISATDSRSWSTGTTYGTASTVPAGQIGKITAYIPGTSSKGYAVYKVYNTSDSTYFWDYRARGGIIPAANAWNFVVQIPST